MTNLNREQQIDLCIKILKSLERNEKRNDLKQGQIDTIKTRIRNIRQQLANLCMSDEELQTLLNS